MRGAKPFLGYFFPERQIFGGKKSPKIGLTLTSSLARFTAHACCDYDPTFNDHLRSNKI